MLSLGSIEQNIVFLVVLVIHDLLVPTIFINLKSKIYKMLSEKYDGRLVFNIIFFSTSAHTLDFVTLDNLRLLF